MPQPNFTGRWKLNRERSKLQIPSPDASLFVIQHDAPRFHLTRTHVYGDQPGTVSFEGTTESYTHACGSIGKQTLP